MKLSDLKSWVRYPYSPVKLAIVLSLPLIIVLIILFISVIHWQKKSIDDIQKKNFILYARALYQHIVTSALWRGSHGGYFVETTEHLNKTISKRRLSIMGKEYTRIDPAVYSPVIDTLTRKRAAYRFHITSLESVNTPNSPDKWERETLVSFKYGTSEEATSTAVIQGVRYYRFMAPLSIKGRCLSCHRNLTAGISIDIPVDFADRLYAAQVKKSAISFATFGLFIIAFVMAITWFFSKRISDGFRTVKRLNEQLEEISARNQKLLDSIVDGIAVISPIGTIEVVNPAFLQITGKNIEDIIGKYPDEIPDDKIKRLFTAKDGEEIEIEDRIYTITDVTVMDPQKEREFGRLRILHDATKEKLSAVMELAGATAHEMRQPLTILLNLLSLLKDKTSDNKDIKEEIEMMESQCIRMNDIITRMLKITQYKKKKYTEDVDIFDIND